MVKNDSALFKVNVENYNGPLEVLLDLAKAQKVNLEDISITKLADQFHDFITHEKDLNLEIASEYLLMATWLAYLKSKLLLPQDEEEEFKISEVAEKLKTQLKKLELIRILSDRLLKKNRLGVDVFMRGIPGGIRSSFNSKYNVTLYDLLKTYSQITMKKNFLSVSIPKLPVFTTEQGITKINENIENLKTWTDFFKLISYNKLKSKKIDKSRISGMFSAVLELSKQGTIMIMQKKIFDKLLIKQNNEQN